MSNEMAPASTPNPGDPQKSKISVGPIAVEATLPKWAIASLSVLILVALAAAGLIYGQSKLDEVRAEADKRVQDAKNNVLVPISEMQTYQASADHAVDLVKEKEDLQQNLHEDGLVLIHHYFKDGCVQIVRYKPGGVTDTKWFFGQGHKFRNQPKPLDHSDNQANVSGSLSLPKDTPFSGDEMAEAALRDAVYVPNSEEARESRLRKGHFVEAGFQGRCLDPHPGAFQFQNVPLNQCLVRVDRVFEDGCAHSQLYNACTGGWDVLPNGAPKVTWTRCLH